MTANNLANVYLQPAFEVMGQGNMFQKRACQRIQSTGGMGFIITVKAGLNLPPLVLETRHPYPQHQAPPRMWESGTSLELGTLQFIEWCYQIP